MSIERGKQLEAVLREILNAAQIAEVMEEPLPKWIAVLIPQVEAVLDSSEDNQA